MDPALIFDMDGVLADTVEPHYRSWQRLADEEGHPFTRADNDPLLGRTREDALRLFLRGRELTERQTLDWLERKNRYFLDELDAMRPGDELPGVRTLLAEARTLGVPTAVASSSRNARRVLQTLDLTHLFDVIADGTSVTRPKPAPDIFVWTAGRLGRSPRECVVLEDAEAGVLAALEGGFHVVGLGPAERVGRAHVVWPDLHGVSVAALVASMREHRSEE